MGYPPPRKCGQTENITSRHPSDAGGKNINSPVSVVLPVRLSVVVHRECSPVRTLINEKAVPGHP